jgi:L-lactate dehydrogenase complex protein LldE
MTKKHLQTRKTYLVLYHIPTRLAFRKPMPIEVDLFVPCFIDQLYPQTAFNTIKILEKLGCKVYYNPNQTCCGQPAYNAGYFPEAKDVAEKFLKDFNTNRYIVSPSASCVGMVCNGYPDLLDTPEQKAIANQTYELVKFLTDVLKIDAIAGAELNGKATYHDSCSALRECGLKEQPRQLLKNVKGLELIEMQDNETCCGFGGTFSVKFESIATGMAEQKAQNALQTGASYIISTDISCLMHIEGYLQKHQIPIKTMHIADVLASGW